MNRNQIRREAREKAKFKPIKINKRTPFNGLKVTSENRWNLIREEQIYNINSGVGPIEALELAKQTMRREQKHFKAWLKRKTKFRFGSVEEERYGEVKKVSNFIDVL